MKLPKFIQKWIRKQFNSKTVCDLCLEPYANQTMDGQKLCKECYSADLYSKKQRG